MSRYSRQRLNQPFKIGYLTPQYSISLESCEVRTVATLSAKEARDLTPHLLWLRQEHPDVRG